MSTVPKKEPTQAAEECPSPDFVEQAQMLRGELDLAVRAEKDIEKRIAKLQEQADLRRLTILILVGKEEYEKFADEQDAAHLAKLEKQNEMRELFEHARATFYAIRDSESLELQPTIWAKSIRAKQLASELYEIIVQRCGAKEAIERQEARLKELNRLFKTINRSIPSENVNGITRAKEIMIGETIRNQIEQIFSSDAPLRDLSREVISRDNEKRQAAQAREDQLAEQIERQNSPLDFEPPFFDPELGPKK
jgi:hypothetical protein